MRSGRRFTFIMAIVVDLLICQTGCVVDVTGVADVDAGHWDSNQVEASKVFTTTLDVGALESLYLVGANGTVDILGVTGTDEISIRAVKRVRSKSRVDAEQHLDLLDVLVTTGSKELGVETDQPSYSGGRTYLVDYEITLPRQFLITVINGNGSVWVENIQADVDVKNGNGGVTLREVEGSTWVTLGNGKIDSQLRLPDGGVVAHAVGNGEIHLGLQSDVSAAFGARVGNGTITLSGLSLSQTVSEPRLLQGILGGGAGLIDLAAGNGTIRVRGS